MTAGDTPVPFTRILVAVDSTPASAAALSYLRGLLCPGATVRMVAVAENPRTLVPLGAGPGRSSRRQGTNCGLMQRQR